jgi:hypothetical protein
MGMHVFYLDCHEVGLCCYLVIHIEDLLHPLQLFYFYLKPVYWLSLIQQLYPSECSCTPKTWLLRYKDII